LNTFWGVGSVNTPKPFINIENIMIKTIGNIFFYGICALLLFVVACQVGLLPLRFTYFLSGSMRPTYEPGDLAFLYVGNNIRVNNGDVVLFTSEGVPTIHRAVNVENGVITTQGDANPAPENKKLARVDGKLLFAIQKVGYALDGVRILIENISQMVRGSG
jgi:signal peptidase I